jgi:twitching motility protein PilT
MVTIAELLVIAASKKASDLHITAGVPPKYRINGELLSMNFPLLAKEDTFQLTQSLLTDYTQEILDEFGEVDFSYAIKGLGRFRVNVFKQRGAFAMVLRLIGTTIPTPEDLEIPYSVIELTKKKRGLVLVTGPTGSGKTTTLASLIDVINLNQNVHIITLEDPIEFLHNHKVGVVNQREIGLDTNSYAGALRAALREDPDVILVGEMRDLETISTAITAAETGHLVFSTLHTIGAAATLDRIIDVFPPHQQQQIRIQLASVLEAVISQKLLPSIDGNSRMAAFEVMHANPAIKNLIRERKTHQIASIIQTSKKLGMQTVDDALYDLYLKRRITADTAISHAEDSIAVQKKIF